jgi:coenzyme F420-dependent glucose-6-phosphate dehydrogenase
MPATNENQNKIGYWASQEQYPMQDLLAFVTEAEKRGFDSCMTSDHFHPWWHENGYGNFTWVWISAAAERTTHMQFVTGVTAAVYRYNPAIIAQAFASLDVLYPGRIALGVGTGEAMNEVTVGFDWPPADVRLARTTEAVEIIKTLWQGKDTRAAATPDLSETFNVNIDGDGFVDFKGSYFKIKSAKLYTPPETKIPIYMAASGERAIENAAKYTDGLITVTNPSGSKEVFDVFDRSARENGKDPQSLQKIGKPKISYDEDYERAFKSTGFWRATLLKNAFDLDINNPRELERKAKKEVSDEKLKDSTIIITSIEDCISPLEEYFRAGFTKLHVHSTSPDELKFVREFCARVLPHFTH